jgi:hypothetical protein
MSTGISNRLSWIETWSVEQRKASAAGDHKGYKCEDSHLGQADDQLAVGVL